MGLGVYQKAGPDSIEFFLLLIIDKKDRHFSRGYRVHPQNGERQLPKRHKQGEEKKKGMFDGVPDRHGKFKKTSKTKIGVKNWGGREGVDAFFQRRKNPKLSMTPLI